MILAQAKEIAEEIVRKLQPFCVPDRCLIAGSIRRQVENPGDIEICCIPIEELYESKEPTLFGDMVLESIVLRTAEFCNAVKSIGKIVKGTKQGRMMQIELPEGIMLDLFMPQHDDFFRQFAIRTGSRKYSHEEIATRWTIKKWRGTPDGLRKNHQCINAGTPERPKWECNVENPDLPPVWASEEEFFRWLGIEYIPPDRRSWA